MTNISFTGEYGGSGTDSISYSNNVMGDVSFSGNGSGGSSHGAVSYSNNIMTNVSFTGEYGGSGTANVNYSNNVMGDVSFTENYSGGSESGDVSYTNNTVSNILLSGKDACTSREGVSNYLDNVVVNDSYDTDDDGLGDGYELFESGTNPRSKEGSSLSSFTLLIALVLFTSFGLALVVYRVRRRVC